MGNKLSLILSAIISAASFSNVSAQYVGKNDFIRFSCSNPPTTDSIKCFQLAKEKLQTLNCNVDSADSAAQSCKDQTTQLRAGITPENLRSPDKNADHYWECLIISSNCKPTLQSDILLEDPLKSKKPLCPKGYVFRQTIFLSRTLSAGMSIKNSEIDSRKLPNANMSESYCYKQPDDKYIQTGWQKNREKHRLPL